MFLDVVQHGRDVGRRDERVHAQRRVHQVAQVRLEVGDVVLLREGHDGLAQRRLDVLGHGILGVRVD